MTNFSMFDTLSDEQEVFDALLPNLLEVVNKNNANPQKLQFKRGKTYSSLWFDTQMVFRICCRKNQYYFSISNMYRPHIPEDIVEHVRNDQGSQDFVNLAFEPAPDHINIFSTFLCKVLDMTIDAIPKQFDCCSRYEECSNSGKCIHPNPSTALTCGYRKILKSGRIYYGKNKNI